MSIHMRTNVVIDDTLLRDAKRYSAKKTTRAVIEEALATFVRLKAEEERRQTYRERLHDLRGKMGALRLSESPSSVLRADRNHRR